MVHRLLLSILLIWLDLGRPMPQDDVAAFYRGKQVRLIVGTAPGGGYDLFARIVARHMAAHIPGQPTVIVQNQPAAGGLVMTNQLYAVGPEGRHGDRRADQRHSDGAAAAAGRAVRCDQADLDRQHQPRALCRLRVAHRAGAEPGRAARQGAGRRLDHARHHHDGLPAGGERHPRTEIQGGARLRRHAADQPRHRARRNPGPGRHRLGGDQGAGAAVDRREEDQGDRAVRPQAPSRSLPTCPRCWSRHAPSPTGRR